MSPSFTLDYLELPSSNGGASGEFFKRAFGWGLVGYSPHYAGIDGAGLEAGIDASADRVAAPLAVIRTNDLEAALQRVLEAGGAVTRAPFDFPGGRRFHFREPGGNEMAVYISRE